MNIVCRLFLVLMICISTKLNADDFSTSVVSNKEVPQNGEQTKRWLELQSSGHAASTNKQNLSGPAMKAVHEKYLESFREPTPDLAIENAKDIR